MITEDRVERTLRLVSQSELFREKLQMIRLLGYLSRHSRNERSTALQQREIAINCLGRSETFDPNKDPIVRIEAARLRKLLDTFYETPDAKQACCRILMPLGGYRLEFSEYLNRHQSTGLSMLLICQSHEGAPRALSQLALEIRQTLSLRLPQFEHINLSVDFLEQHQAVEMGVAHLLTDEAHDYILRIEVVDDLDLNFLISSVLIHRATQEIIWSQCADLSKQYDETEAKGFYRGLIAPVAGDAFGVVGQHWSDRHWKLGIEQIDARFQAFVCLIQVVRFPTLKNCQQAVNLLQEHLKQNPNDIHAHFCYLSMGCIGDILNYKLVDGDSGNQLTKCLNLMAFAPDHAGIVALLGFCYFKSGDNERASLYLKDAMRLCPDSGLLKFMYSAFCLQEGCAAEGIELINELLQYNESPPALYYIPLFFSHIGAGRLSEAAFLATKVVNVDGLSDLSELLIAIEVGGVRLDFESLKRRIELDDSNHQVFPDWIESDLLNKYPDMKQKVKGLLMMRQSL